eukprot:Lankesteria_metandrocarpae@DN9378_c0_g1_i1.p1
MVIQTSVTQLLRAGCCDQQLTLLCKLSTSGADGNNEEVIGCCSLPLCEGNTFEPRRRPLTNGLVNHKSHSELNNEEQQRSTYIDQGGHTRADRGDARDFVKEANIVLWVSSIRKEESVAVIARRSQNKRFFRLLKGLSDKTHFAMWLYRDKQGTPQGPYDSLKVLEWIESGYFSPDTPFACYSSDTPSTCWCTLKEAIVVIKTDSLPPKLRHSSDEEVPLSSEFK